MNKSMPRFTRFLSLVLLISMLVTNAHAEYPFEDVQKLKNDKESFTAVLKKREIKKLKEKYKDEKFHTNLRDIVYKTIHDFLNNDNKLKCELTLLELIKTDLQKNKLANSEEDILEYLKVLRLNNHIDDIFFKLLKDINIDFHALKELDAGQFVAKPIRNFKKLAANNDLVELYEGFAKWPDGKNRCVYNEFVWLKNNTRTKKDKIQTEEEKENEIPEERTGENKELRQLNKVAFKKKLISKETYNKLEYLRTKSTLDKKLIWLNKYFTILSHAKNRLNPLSTKTSVEDVSLENKYTQEKVRRFRKLTRRQLLYSKYDQTEIIILAQILQRASQRMGVDPDTDTGAPKIVQEFSVLQADGTRSNYVEELELDAQEQFTLARKRLSRDITDVQMMQTFTNKEITYDDIVVAAFETGYISFEDIEYVVQYDDLWNPELTPFDKVMKFTFVVAGYSSFYVPPPWNAVVSIALGVVQGLIYNRNLKGRENDNTASIID